MYLQGLGVPNDNIAAYMWASLSAAGGSGPGAKLREKIATKLMPQEIEAGKRRVLDYGQARFAQSAQNSPVDS